MYKNFFERLIDIILRIVRLLVLFIDMLINGIIKIHTKDPAIFVGDKVEKDNKIFKCYKLRSMTNKTARSVATRDLNSQEYITKIEKFIRKTSIEIENNFL